MLEPVLTATRRLTVIAAMIAGCLGTPGLALAQQAHDHDAPDTTTPAEQKEYPSLKISGFGDVDYSATDKPEGPKGFNLGQFVLHMASELSPRVTFFGELSLSAR